MNPEWIERVSNNAAEIFGVAFALVFLAWVGTNVALFVSAVIIEPAVTAVRRAVGARGSGSRQSR